MATPVSGHTSAAQNLPHADGVQITRDFLKSISESKKSPQPMVTDKVPQTLTDPGRGARALPFTVDVQTPKPQTVPGGEQPPKDPVPPAGTTGTPGTPPVETTPTGKPTDGATQTSTDGATGTGHAGRASETNGANNEKQTDDKTKDKEKGRKRRKLKKILKFTFGALGTAGGVLLAVAGGLALGSPFAPFGILMIAGGCALGAGSLLYTVSTIIPNAKDRVKGAFSRMRHKGM